MRTEVVEPNSSCLLSQLLICLLKVLTRLKLQDFKNTRMHTISWHQFAHSLEPQPDHINVEICFEVEPVNWIETSESDKVDLRLSV